MRIIKQYHPASSTCVVRTDTYASSLEHLQALYDAACHDFPDLQAKDVEVVKYGGEWIKRIFGLEFKMGAGDVPASYREIKELELHL